MMPTQLRLLISQLCHYSPSLRWNYLLSPVRNGEDGNGLKLQNISQPRPKGLLGIQNGDLQKNPRQRADHVTLNYPITKPAANLKQSKSLIFLETCDPLFARVFPEPRRPWGRGSTLAFFFSNSQAAS